MHVWAALGLLQARTPGFDGTCPGVPMTHDRFCSSFRRAMARPQRPRKEASYSQPSKMHHTPLALGNHWTSAR